MLALGMIIPVLPRLVIDFLGGQTARAAEIYGLFGTIWALMQFVFSPVLGALSDRFGRRPVILVSNVGLGLDYLLMALAPNLSWLFVGRVISGITAASIATSYAYIADVTPAERRSSAFGLLGAAFGIGFILGPALGGIAGGVSPRLPFWLAGGFSLANALYGLLVLPESLPRDRRAPFRWSKANPVGSLSLLGSKPELIGLAAVYFVASLAHVVLPSTFVLYANYRYHWAEREVGLTLAGVGLASMIVQGAIVRPAVRKFGERGALLFGLAFGALGFVIYGLAPTGLLFLLGVPVMALWGLSGPASQGLMTARVDASSQGQLQGANSSLQAIGGLVGPGLFTMTFAAFIKPDQSIHLPGAPFLLAAALLGLAFAIASLTIR